MGQMKAYRLSRHEAKPVHVDAVLRLVHPERKQSEMSLPPRDLFMAVLGWVRKGGSLRGGIPSVGAFAKCRRLLFCLAEGFKRMYRQWLRDSCTANILRDERHARLLIRFRCATVKAQRYIGVIGQPRIVKSNATNITETTKDAISEFALRTLEPQTLKKMHLMLREMTTCSSIFA